MHFLSRNRHPKKEDRLGFTLVEVIVATVILALLASGVFSVFVSARYLVARSKRRFAAVEVARKIIEDNRYRVNATWDSGAINGSGTWSAWNNVTYAPYHVRYRTENATSPAGWRKITVDVRWDEQQI